MTASDQLTLKQAQARVAEEVDIDKNELRILLAHLLNTDRIGLILKENDPLPFDEFALFKKLAKRREAGEPIAYITGHKEFYSRPFEVNQSVLIPRPETEELVERALIIMADISETQLLTRVLDFGTGSGAIAITLALENPLLEVTGLDVSADAIEVAKRNASSLRCNQIQWVCSDGFSAIRKDTSPTEQFDLIVSNPPYIPRGDCHLEQGDLQHEPTAALTDFADGLNFYRLLASEGKRFVRSGGYLLVEHGYDQQKIIIELFKQSGFEEVIGITDLSGHPRMVQCRKPLLSNE